MKLSRTIACLWLAMALTVGPALAQEWPRRFVKIVVGFPAGTSTDVVARIYADKLKDEFKQPFIVENMPGVSGGLAATSVANSSDGHTLYLVTIANAIGQSIFKSLRFDLLEDFVPITALASSPAVLVVSPKFPVTSVKELVDYAKAKPDEISYASGGLGTAPHVVAELFNQRAGTKIQNIPYKSLGEAASDLLMGRVSVMFAPLPAVASHLENGQLKALAIASSRRSPLLPQTPTFAELGFDRLEAEIWYGIIAPKSTTSAVVNMLSEALNRAANDPDTGRKLAAAGAVPIPSSPQAFSLFIRDEIAKWEAVVKAADVKSN